MGPRNALEERETRRFEPQLADARSPIARTDSPHEDNRASRIVHPHGTPAAFAGREIQFVTMKFHVASTLAIGSLFLSKAAGAPKSFGPSASPAYSAGARESSPS